MKNYSKNNVYQSMNLIKTKLLYLYFKYLLILFLLTIIVFYILFYRNYIFNNIINNNILKNKYYIFKFINNYLNKYDYFKINYLKYSFSFKYNIAKLEYHLGFYNKNNELIIPSDFTLYNKLNLICHINDTIYSLPNINNKLYYVCIEYFALKENVSFGIKILNNIDSKQIHSFIFFNHNIINYNNLNYNNEFNFDPLILINQYQSLFQQVKNSNFITNKSLTLKKTYIQKPLFSTKKNIILHFNIWYFKNLYNSYFCFCKGKNCLKIQQNCKYYFYLNIIDNNRNIFKKTDYLLADFIFFNRSLDDVFPVFQKMIKLKMPAHYMTENLDIYKKYCYYNKYCNSIILVNRKSYEIKGYFLENYLTIILKLKAAISGSHFPIIGHLFYHLDYITYISVGHGISILKKFLYSEKSYYGSKKFNKILLPPSKRIIAIAKSYGWNDQNIIKINLPRWDKYYKINKFKNKDSYFFNSKREIKTNSIFVMFTWRSIRINKKISNYYINNILNLITDNKLNKALINNNITLYFTLHHLVRKLQYIFDNGKYIEYIYENEISEVLSKTNLVVTDFSSIIFDLICRKKPYIIFIPDAKDPEIKNIYKKHYYEVIKSFINSEMNFENVYLDINETVNKIIYYIYNNFKLEKKMIKFYKSFAFKYGNNIKLFIQYLKKLK